MRAYLQRRTDTTWRQCLRTQASTVLACGFFHVDCALTQAGQVGGAQVWQRDVATEGAGWQLRHRST